MLLGQIGDFWLSAAAVDDTEDNGDQQEAERRHEGHDGVDAVPVPQVLEERSSGGETDTSRRPARTVIPRQYTVVHAEIAASDVDDLQRPVAVEHPVSSLIGVQHAEVRQQPGDRHGVVCGGRDIAMQLGSEVASWDTLVVQVT